MKSCMLNLMKNNCKQAPYVVYLIIGMFENMSTEAGCFDFDSTTIEENNISSNAN